MICGFPSSPPLISTDRSPARSQVVTPVLDAVSELLDSAQAAADGSVSGQYAKSALEEAQFDWNKLGKQPASALFESLNWNTREPEHNRPLVAMLAPLLDLAPAISTAVREAAGRARDKLPERIDRVLLGGAGAGNEPALGEAFAARYAALRLDAAMGAAGAGVDVDDVEASLLVQQLRSSFSLLGDLPALLEAFAAVQYRHALLRCALAPFGCRSGAGAGAAEGGADAAGPGAGAAEGAQQQQEPKSFTQVAADVLKELKRMKLSRANIDEAQFGAVLASLAAKGPEVVRFTAANEKKVFKDYLFLVRGAVVRAAVERAQKAITDDSSSCGMTADALESEIKKARELLEQHMRQGEAEPEADPMAAGDDGGEGEEAHAAPRAVAARPLTRQQVRPTSRAAPPPPFEFASIAYLGLRV